MIYFVDLDTLSTVSSSLEYPTVTGPPISPENLTEVLIFPTVTTNTTVQPPTTSSFLTTTDGVFQYTTLNNLTNAQETLTMQTNYFEGITYYINTLSINTNLTGTAQTTCAYAGTSPTDDSGPLPQNTIYTYNRYVPFDSSFNIASAEFEGAQAVKSLAEAYLGNGVNCTIAGHGTGTVKVGVTALTSVAVSYLPQVAVTAPTTPSTPPPVSVKTTSVQVGESPTSPVVPVTTPATVPVPPPSASIPSPPASSVLLVSPTLTSGTIGELTTQVEIISGPSGPETFSQIYTAGIGPAASTGEVTTEIQTISGPSGVETISATLTGGIGSYILSVVGVTPTPATTEGGQKTSSTTSQAAFTGGAARMKCGGRVWATGFGVVVMLMMC